MQIKDGALYLAMNMSNISSIVKRQNTEVNIMNLRAQRQCYNIAKKFYLFRMSLILFLPIFSIAMYFSFDNEKANTVLIVTSAGLIISLIIEFFEQKYNHMGANIQEIFDTEVFQIPWHSELIGNKVRPETIYQFAMKEKSPLEKIVDWYTGLEAKNEKINILVAQRMNLCWSLEQKSKFKLFLLSCSIVLGIILILIGSINDFSLNNFFITLLFPTTSLFIYLIKNFYELSRQEKEMNRIIGRIDYFINRGNPKNYEIRAVQDAIYIHGRLPNHVVPDVLYNKIRKEFETTFKRTNKELTTKK